jgi:hypothetical protein
LKVETALAEGTRQRRSAGRAAEAADVAAGIDAFELNLNRVGADEGGLDEGGGSGASAPPGQGVQQQRRAMAQPAAAGADAREGPMATLSRLRAFAPAATALAKGSSAYLAAIQARRRDEAGARREREVRRRRLMVESAAARRGAEDAAEADALVDLLAAKSSEEVALAAQLWRLRQEEGAMRENRLLREAAYVEARERDGAAASAREGELAR